MRLHRTSAIALGGAVALTLVVAQPAAAATSSWTGTSDAAWSTGVGWGGTAPADGDDLVFSAGPRSTYNLGDHGFASLSFGATHEIANGGGAITVHGGIDVDANSAVRIQPQLDVDATQTWHVGQGSTLTLPSMVRTDGTSVLTLDVAGTMTIEATGNLDALATGCVVKTGAGILQVLGGGGGMGTCAGQPAGLNVAAGEVAVGEAQIGGKDFAVTGGVFTGGTSATPATVHMLNLTGTGVVSPGPASGDGLGMVSLWGTSTWNGGTYQADWDVDTDRSDYVFGSGQAITVNGTKLDVRLTGTPAAGDFVRILGSDISYTGQFAAPDGTPLADGDEFTSNGQVYSLEYISSGGASGVLLHWLRAAPAPTPTPTPTPSADPVSTDLASTGAADAWPSLAAAAGVAALGVVLLTGRRRVRRAR